MNMLLAILFGLVGVSAYPYQFYGYDRPFYPQYPAYARPRYAPQRFQNYYGPYRQVATCSCAEIAFDAQYGALGSAAYSAEGCTATVTCPIPTVDMHYNAAGSIGSIALNPNGGNEGIGVILACQNGGWMLQSITTSDAQNTWGGDAITDIECSAA